MKRCPVQTFHKRQALIPRLVFVLCVSVGAAPSHANGGPISGAWLLGLELQQRSFDTMSASDSRPVARADAGVRGSIDWLLAPRWALGLSAHFGGSWFDWSDPVSNTAGKVEDTAWDTRLGVDRVLSVGQRGMALIGVGVEYGEARSWVHTLGPHCYATGGYARLASMTPVWRRMALCAQVSESFYSAHALDPPFGTKFDWLGRSLAVSVGLRFEIVRGRVSVP